MKALNYLILTICLFATSLIVSCGGGDDTPDPTPTEKEKIVSALTTKSWTINSTTTDLSGVNTTFDTSTIGISFSETSTGISFTLSGDVAGFLSGGSFDLSDAGAVSNPVVNVVSTDLEVSGVTGPTISNENSFTVTVTTTESAGKSNGLGVFVLAFDGA